MKSQEGKSRNSKARLEALRKEFRRRSKERKKSGISSKDFPSMTLEEQRREGLSTEPTLVISFGQRKMKSK